MRNLIALLQSGGVTVLAPETVFVAPDVVPSRIAPGVLIHPGCRLAGADLSIGPDCVLGAEAPVTVTNCQMGRGVRLAGGFFDRATFLDGFQAGSGAHVRPGCLFEEEASLAHAVGVKQTVLMPWVTAGSLINFCDCLMAGGVGRKNHSEIGSSYVHFNFTPHQDKATASLIGDVPNGVLLNQPPIFLGGQGGLVGPCRIAFGTVIPAGQIWRGDVLEPGLLVAKAAQRGVLRMPYDPRVYRGIRRVALNNLLYIGNILALDHWYRVVRSRFMASDAFAAACHVGARQRLAEILQERVARLDEFSRKVAQSPTRDPSAPAALEHRDFVERWPTIQARLGAILDARETETPPEAVQRALSSLPASGYARAIQSLAPEAATLLRDWLAQAPTTCAALYRDEADLS